LRYTGEFALAVAGAKAAYKSAADGVQQAKHYAQILRLKLAHGTNALDLAEFDYIARIETHRTSYPALDELWNRYCSGAGLSNDKAATHLLEPYNHAAGKGERFYQQIAINRVAEDILTGHRHLLAA
jgi:type I restriction enzyme, R subunit